MNIISALIVVMMVITTHAMELQLESQNITFKSLQGFPLISLHKGKSWAEKLSEKKRNQVYEHIINYNDTRLLVLFNVATKLPSDTQRALALRMFCNNENAAHKFLNDPIVDVLECYAWVQERDFPFTPEFIFEHSKDLRVFDNVQRRSFLDAMCSKHELEALVAVREKFKDLKVSMFGVRYQFYEPFTVNNFKKQWNQDQLGSLFFVLAAYINLTFPAAYRIVLNKDISKYNLLAEQFNIAVDHLNQETGNQFPFKNLLSLDVLAINHFAIIKALSWVPGIVFLINYVSACKGGKLEFEKLLISGILSSVGLLKLIYFVGSHFEEGNFWGVGCMAGLYGLLCCGYNTIKMHSWQDGWVRLDKLSGLLQRDDIVIK